MHSPFTMPIYLHGSLQYFADVRAANGLDERLAMFFRKFDNAINDQIAASDMRRSPRVAARPFNLDACFRMGEG